MKTSRFLLMLVLAVMLLGGCTKEQWQEMYLSDILGTWSGYADLSTHSLTATFNNDKTFTYRLDNGEVVSGTYKYVSVGGMITLTHDGKDEKFYVYDIEDNTMKLVHNFVTYNMQRYGNYNH